MSSDLRDNNQQAPSYDGTKSSLSKHLEALYKWLRHKDAAYKSLVTKGHALSSRGKTTVSCTEVRIEHIKDTDNMSDFLTKWTPRAKYERSVRYTSGEAAVKAMESEC